MRDAGQVSFIDILKCQIIDTERTVVSKHSVLRLA
jgi:hypothetical protein